MLVGLLAQLVLGALFSAWRFLGNGHAADAATPSLLEDLFNWLCLLVQGLGWFSAAARDRRGGVGDAARATLRIGVGGGLLLGLIAITPRRTLPTPASMGPAAWAVYMPNAAVGALALAAQAVAFFASVRVVWLEARSASS